MTRFASQRASSSSFVAGRGGAVAAGAGAASARFATQALRMRGSDGAAAPSEPLILKAWVAKRAEAAPAPAATAPPLPATNDDDDARWLANLVKAEMQN